MILRYTASADTTPPDCVISTVNPVSAGVVLVVVCVTDVVPWTICKIFPGEKLDAPVPPLATGIIPDIAFAPPSLVIAIMI